MAGLEPCRCNDRVIRSWQTSEGTLVEYAPRGDSTEDSERAAIAAAQQEQHDHAVAIAEAARPEPGTKERT